MTDESRQPADCIPATDGGTSDVPPIEDAHTPPPAEPESVAEDDPQLLDPSTRALEVEDTSGVEGDGREAVSADATRDDSGDADGVSVDADASTAELKQYESSSLEHGVAAYRIAVELKRVEAGVRDLLESRDPKRKRKLSGSRRWRELEEDALEWRFSNRFDEASLAELRRLIARRNHLFHRLRFVAATRTRWNS